MATESVEACHPIVTPAANRGSFAALANDFERALADREARDDQAALEAQGRAWDAVREMAERPAATLAERQAKARAVAFAFEEQLEGDGTDVRVLRSLLADIEALAP